jgi:FlaG protein
MRIDPADNSVAVSHLPLPSGSPTRAGASPRNSAPSPALPQAASGLHSPQHEVSRSFDTNRNIIYRFVDKDTGEVVEQIPPEETLRLMQRIQDLLQKSEAKLRVTG